MRYITIRRDINSKDIGEWSFPLYISVEAANNIIMYLKLCLQKKATSWQP